MNARDVENITLALSAWGGGQLVAPFEEIAERARVVGVLDAYTSPDATTSGLAWSMQVDEEEQLHFCIIKLTRIRVRSFAGKTPDAARAAAAKAIEAGEV